MKNNQNLIWIDLEMTGLDPLGDVILEIATIVTDPHLNILEEGPVFALNQPEAVLLQMDEWNTRQHTQSGLITRVKESLVTAIEAEEKTIEFLKQYVDKGKSPMCGNTVCQDRRFLSNYMPTLCNYFHYRHLDVSTLKELALRWRPELLKGVTKESKHLALDDIRDSINELVYYRQHFMNMGKYEVKHG